MENHKRKKYSRVYVEITNICNKSCSFCPGTRRQKRQMSAEEFGHVARELRPLTDYLYFHVMGEPLTHPALPDFIKSATDMGYKCAVTTNGTLLSRRGEQLVKAGVYKVNISVHSFESGEDSFYRQYIRECLDFADFASERGVLTVLRLWNKGHDGGRNDGTLAMMKERFPDGEWSFGPRGARIRDKLHLEYGDRFEWPDSDAADGGDSVFCYGLRDHFGILCDGRVVPCCLDHEGDIALGNIFDEPIEDILSAERAVNMVKGFNARHAAEELCRRCGYARRFK